MGEHQQETIVVFDDFEVVMIFFFPGRLQGKAERPVDFSAPERVEDYLPLSAVFRGS